MSIRTLVASRRLAAPLLFLLGALPADTGCRSDFQPQQLPRRNARPDFSTCKGSVCLGVIFESDLTFRRGGQELIIASTTGWFTTACVTESEVSQLYVFKPEHMASFPFADVYDLGEAYFEKGCTRNVLVMAIAQTERGCLSSGVEFAMGVSQTNNRPIKPLTLQPLPDDQQDLCDQLSGLMK